MFKKKFIKITFRIVILLFVILNALTAIQAYKFTHYTNDKVKRTKRPDSLTVGEKLKVLFTGVNNPRPVDAILPEEKFERIEINSNKKIECWFMQEDGNMGTVILFHGYGGSKSALIENAKVFNQLHYNTLLVDFMGSGSSEGNQTTIGYYESGEVRDAYTYIYIKGERNIMLYGVSMGAVAIIKAMHDDSIHPKAIILECPFGSMYRTICNRCNNMGVPVFPTASLLTFWGGIENGFWAFSYKPSEYAKSIKCPTLLIYGAKDKNVSREETDEIYSNLKGKKKLIIFPDAGHENYLKKHPSWCDRIKVFMNNISN